MSKVIVAFCGLENSKKYRYCNELHAYMLNNYVDQPDGIKSYVDEHGNLRVLTEFVSPNGTRDTSMEILNVFQRNFDYMDWATHVLWPYIKIINFTDPVLNIMETLFGYQFKLERKKSPVTWKGINRFLTMATIKKLKDSNQYTKRLSLYEVEKFFAYEVIPRFRRRALINLWDARYKNSNSEITVVTDCFKLEELNKLQYEKAIMVYCPSNEKNKNFFSGQDELQQFKFWDITTNDETNIIQELKDRIQF